MSLGRFKTMLNRLFTNQATSQQIMENEKLPAGLVSSPIYASKRKPDIRGR